MCVCGGLCFGVEILNFATGEQGKVEGRDRVGIVEGSCRKTFIETQGVIGHRRPVSGAPSSGTPRESQAKFRHGTVWVLLPPLPAGSLFGGNSFYRETRVQDEGVAMWLNVVLIPG